MSTLGKNSLTQLRAFLVFFFSPYFCSHPQSSKWERKEATECKKGCWYFASQQTLAATTKENLVNNLFWKAFKNSLNSKKLNFSTKQNIDLFIGKFHFFCMFVLSQIFFFNISKKFCDKQNLLKSQRLNYSTKQNIIFLVYF